MSIFSIFVNSNVPKIDPLPPLHVGTMFSFVGIYRFLINPLTISQNFILISFFVKKSRLKNLWGVHSTPHIWARVKKMFSAIFDTNQRKDDVILTSLENNFGATPA